MQTPISEYMTTMPKTIGHDMTVSKARAMMTELNCHHLPVLDGGQLVGIVSDRDLKMVETVPSGSDKVIEDLMMDEPIVVQPTITVAAAVNKLLDEKVGSLIISATEDTPWGIFTITDALKLFASKFPN